eukprot:NODE_3765_length_854_cov_55.445667_g3742_i0.p1 GENE.NODE_3765_length_854_cov_55.445667_g3742_i0~~NODE_3765_length_854_cov_55.445667_g3742_i0.p1  ORF type:complete len:210 (+),score=20.35 NODE_3765_length_854_cov_55.445667_g3742_i0:74-703(+)
MASRGQSQRPKLMINTQANVRTVQKIGLHQIHDTDCDTVPEEFATEIVPHLLYLGTSADASNVPLLRTHNIKYVLNTAKECELSLPSDMRLLQFPLEDNSDAPISAYFEEAFHFIEEARSAGVGVLVHCRRGISRSAAITIAYLMRRDGYRFDLAFEYVKRKRDVINPNLGFVLALEQYSPPAFTAHPPAHAAEPKPIMHEVPIPISCV